MTERFELLEQLGKGGMGTVWKARDGLTGEIVALKLLHEQYADDPYFLQRFEREVEITLRVQSPHVVKMLGYGNRDGRPYVAMEIVEGRSLKVVIQERVKLSWEETKDLMRQIALGLEAAEKAGVIHRDIKPSNILITRDGFAKLVDFGVAKATDMTALTGSHTTFGTAGYMAPEGKASAQADLYALGCIAYEMLAGVPPFTGDTQGEVLVRHIRELPDLARLPSAARPIVGWLLKKEPGGRPAGAAVLLAALDGSTGTTGPRANLPASAGQSTARTRLGMVTVGLLGILSAIVIAGVGAFVAATGGRSGGDGDTTATPFDVAPSGTITIGATQFETWDPHFSDFAQDIAHMVYVWRGLYHLDLNDNPQPAMADGAPKVSDDGKTYTITLKKDLKWSDGQPLTAEDFVLGIQRTCNPDVAGHYQYILTNIVGCDDYYAAADATADKKTELQNAVGVKAIDATTLEIKIGAAQPTFPTLLALWPTFPAPKHKLATVDADWPGPLENVYNGPFMPFAYTEKATLKLVPNPNWVGGNVGVEKVILKYVDDAAVLSQAYRLGEVDATVANKPELDKLKTEFPNELHLYPGIRTIGLEFNVTRAPVNKAEVRLALSQATDRETMMKVVFNDANTSTTSWVPPARNGLKGGEYDDILGFNVAKAKENMSKAGYPDGMGFPELTLLIGDSAMNKLLGEFLQTEWKKHLGIDLKLEIADSKTRSSLFNASDFQLATGGWQEDYPNPENWFLGLWETGGSFNKQKVSIKALDLAIDNARYNTNDEARRKLYRDAEGILLKEANGIAPLYHTLAAMLVKPHIKGMVENKRPGDTFVPGDWYIELWAVSNE